MDERILKIKTPEKCEIFAKNARNKNREDLAIEAKQRAIQLRAESYGAKTDAERECIEAVYAYEQTLSAKKGKNIRASRTWQMIKRHGIIEAAERAVKRKQETSGYLVLVEMGLEQYAFEAVIIKYPQLFSVEAIEISKQRLSEWKGM